MDQRKNLIVEALQQLFSPASIVERNDVPVRKAEGLPLVAGLLFGQIPEILQIDVAGSRFESICRWTKDRILLGSDRQLCRGRSTSEWQAGT